MSWEYELVAGSLGSPTDGPVWNGELLLFTQSALPANAANNRILSYNPGNGELTDFRRWTNHTTSRHLIPHWEEALPEEARSTLAKDVTIHESD